MSIMQKYFASAKTGFIILISVLASLSMVSCQQKADIIKLFNETGSRLELNFEYIHVAEGTFSGMTDGELYHVDYDKRNQLVHIFSSRLAYIHIDEIYFVTMNKFLCTDTQICFQNDDVRVIIENADNYYIVHVYEKSGYGLSGKWNKYATFFNSKTTPNGLNEGLENNSDARTEDILSDEEVGDTYNPDAIERKAQNFLSKYKNESKYKALLGYPTDTQIVKLFPVSIASASDDSNVFKITFSKYDFENKKKEFGLTEDLPLAGLYVVYDGELYDCFDLETDDNGTVSYICRPHEIWDDI